MGRGAWLVRRMPAWPRWLAGAMLLLSLTAISAGQVLGSGCSALDCKTFRVTMTTKLVVPDKNVLYVFVWHALPDKKPWSGTDTDSGVADLDYSPDEGAEEFDAEHHSHHILWKMGELSPGQQLTFTTQFTVRSARRSFDPKIATSWPSDFKAPSDVNKELAKVADKIKEKHSPASAVLEFSKWIEKHLRYDASVPYPPTDVESIVARRRGHCGHFYTVFAEMCRRVGIQARSVTGLNLYSPNGKGPLQKIRPDWTNIHTWAEVYFPEAGWVEVEPALGQDAYDIPAQYIKNNGWFQNYVVWANEGGSDRMVTWKLENGRYRSDYKISSIVDFTVVPGENRKKS